MRPRRAALAASTGWATSPSRPAPEIHVTLDNQQRTRIRSGYLGANAELLASLQRLLHQNFHIR
ncbi:hypothetical protein [Streptomyces sp. NPDC056660]|uniref:hypothetical protein n=1 Tax=Streptomyces sp. NPDC056660 TaxID=3345897 RepID=UPI003683A7E3